MQLALKDNGSDDGAHDVTSEQILSSQMSHSRRPLLEMRSITKKFGVVAALRDVSFTVCSGETHALVGENGAGKSTLMKVLSGVYPHDSYEGDIFFAGEKRAFRSITDSESIGIVIIHQELALIPQMTIAENIFLNHAPNRFGVIDQEQVYLRTREVLAKVGLTESPDTVVGTLGVGKQQLIEIAKALSKNVKLLILDEPTASLNESDSTALLDLLKNFRSQGMTSILISHKLNEVMAVADEITVLRDGKTVSTVNCHHEHVEEDWIIRKMVDRDMDDRYPKRKASLGEVVLEVDNWYAEHPTQADRVMVDHVSLNVRAGEVLGIAGLMGAGRTEFAMSLFGRSYGRNIKGEARMSGKPVDLSTVSKAIAAGIAYVTEDRKQLGLILAEEMRTNITLANLKAVANKNILDPHKEIRIASDYRERIRIRSQSIYQRAENLSGGNQQKILLSKWLFTGSKVLILDEPTRGIDVGAKYEIYGLINKMAEEGKAIIVISSEMPELLGMCDRIMIMDEGRFVGEVAGAQATQENIMRAIMRRKGE